MMDLVINSDNLGRYVRFHEQLDPSQFYFRKDLFVGIYMNDTDSLINSNNLFPVCSSKEGNV